MGGKSTKLKVKRTNGAGHLTQEQACILELLLELQTVRFRVAGLERQLAESNRQVKDAASFLYARSKQMGKVMQ